MIKQGPLLPLRALPPPKRLKLDLSGKLKELYEKQEGDVRINCRDGYRIAQSFLIKNDSPYFEELLVEENLKDTDNGKKVFIVDLPDFSVAHVDVLLRKVYYNESISVLCVNEVDAKFYVEIYKLLVELKVQKLTNLLDYLTVSNVLSSSFLFLIELSKLGESEQPKEKDKKRIYSMFILSLIEKITRDIILFALKVPHYCVHNQSNHGRNQDGFCCKHTTSTSYASSKFKSKMFCNPQLHNSYCCMSTLPNLSLNSLGDAIPLSTRMMLITALNTLRN